MEQQYPERAYATAHQGIRCCPPRVKLRVFQTKGARNAKNNVANGLAEYKYICDEGHIMSNLLLKFKSKDSPYGVTRETLKALADELDISETMVVHLALSRFAKEVLPANEADDGQLTAGAVTRIRKLAEPMLPKGKVVNTRSLL
jgi:hypothetical protein